MARGRGALTGCPDRPFLLFMGDAWTPMGVPACCAPSEGKQRSRQADALTQDTSIKLNTR